MRAVDVRDYGHCSAHRNRHRPNARALQRFPGQVLVEPYERVLQHLAHLEAGQRGVDELLCEYLKAALVNVLDFADKLELQ